MSIKRFEIRLVDDEDRTFDGPQALYYTRGIKPGYTYYGIVFIETDSPVEYNSLDVNLIGKETVQFNGKKFTCGKPCQRPLLYTAEEILLNLRYHVHGTNRVRGTNVGTTYTLVRGSYSYLFKFSVPYGFPSSFTSCYGDVEYKLKGTLRGPDRGGFQIETATEIKVDSWIHAKDYDFLSTFTPVYYRIPWQVFKCECAGYIPPEFFVMLNRSAFSSVNDEITLVVREKDLINWGITDITVTAYKLTTYRASCPKRKIREVRTFINSATMNPEDAEDRQENSNQFVKLKLPEEACRFVENTKMCKLISSDYFVTISLKSTFCVMCCNLKLKKKITGESSIPIIVCTDGIAEGVQAVGDVPPLYAEITPDMLVTAPTYLDEDGYKRRLCPYALMPHHSTDLTLPLGTSPPPRASINSPQSPIDSSVAKTVTLPEMSSETIRSTSTDDFSMPPSVEMVRKKKKTTFFQRLKNRF